MARDFLAISATGVPVERLFSAGPHVLTGTRQRLTQPMIQKCICLKFWLLRKNSASNITGIIKTSVKSKVFGTEYLDEDEEI
jgi:hypothetical protein